MRSIIIALTAVLGLATTACGSDAAGDSIPSTVDDSTTATLPDACTLLSNAEVEQLTGTLPTTARPAGIDDSLSVCQWGNDAGDIFSVTLQTDHDWDTQVEIASARGDDNYRVLSGVGDRAYVELERFVQAEHNGLLVIVGPVDEDNIGSLESMTNTVISRLP